MAAAFLGHCDPKITKKYYHKGADDERMQVAPALALLSLVRMVSYLCIDLFRLLSGADYVGRVGRKM